MKREEELRELATAGKDSLHAQWLLSQIMIALGNLKDDQAKQCAGHVLAHTLEEKLQSLKLIEQEEEDRKALLKRWREDEGIADQPGTPAKIRRCGATRFM